ncbi:Pleckstrin -like domain-containing protein isoform 1 [Cladophialophora immunda]|nr:Pleckstrin -like domain-containing protein isoform 1 [Cladophialophora immunda]
MRSEKADTKHSDAAWARETGKGLLFYSKRAEDKATPAGIINLSDASTIAKEGFQFSFKAGAHVHRFEASSAKERDSWIAALEKTIEEGKSLKEDVTGRESYKKNVEEYAKPAIAPVAAAVKTSRSKSKEPKKSVDASTAAAAAAADAAATSSDADETTKPAAERSQSRKRGSIFGTLLSKKEEHAEKKEEKPEVPAKDETKETPEAAEASAASAVPAAVVASDKKEEKEDVSPTEKKGKRGSVFGSLFRNRVASPTTEKSEKDAMATSDVPPVSETAPKIEEPIENKPIDAAAVTAPVDTVTTPAEEPAAAGESSSAPKTEKKGGLISFIKKTEAKLEGKKETKEESKEDKAAEAIAKEPVAAASTEPAETAAPTEAAAETTAPATEERPARDNKRRTSLFFNKKQHETPEADDTVAEPKREKSPLPGGKFIGQLVRRASKAIKSEGPKEKTAEPAAAPASATEAPASETPVVAPEAAETKPAEPVPEPVQSTPEAVATTAPEVKATA